MLLAVFFSFVILIANSSFFNVFFYFFYFFLFSNLAINKSDNKYYNKNLFIKLLTILPKSIISIYQKIFIKTADLAYFNRLKKHNKIWDHRIQLLKVKSKEKYQLYNNYIFILVIKLYHCLLILILSFEKYANFKKNVYIFLTNTFFNKIKAYLWKCSKINLNKSYFTIKDKISIFSQI